MGNYQCTVCGFRYNELHGDPKNGIPENTPFYQLAGTLCSRCGLQGERHQKQPNPKYRSLEAEYYDFFVGKRGINFYRHWLASYHDQVSVLDLGIGTGRLAVELLKDGASVTGVDWSEDMLTVAERRFKRFNHDIELFQEDILHFSLNKKFTHIILTEGTFQECTSPGEQKMIIQKAKEHLETGGYLSIDLVFPNELSVQKETSQKQVSEHKTIQLHTNTKVSFARQMMYYTVYFELERKGLLESRYRVERELSLLTVQELIYLLTMEGFHVIGSYDNANSSMVDIYQSSQQLAREENLSEKEIEVKNGYLNPYKEDAWNGGGYPLSNAVQKNGHSFTVIAKS
ncbi:methyltransferase domain-containing protein [Halalkalibacter lacteus]|uniref:methyltransferase domain-containing protein n=1 Tax=Halalkalibacter lacteus TaxID=3090663 RepID=UPI002FC9701E